MKLKAFRTHLEDSDDDILSVLDGTFFDDPSKSVLLTHSYLSENDKQDEDLMAHVEALRATNDLCTFVFQYSGEELLGYWHGPEGLSEDRSDFVFHDTEGHYEIIDAENLPEALCYWHLYNSEDEDEFNWLVEVLSVAGFQVRQRTFDEINRATINPMRLRASIDPNKYCDRVYRKLS